MFLHQFTDYLSLEKKYSKHTVTAYNSDILEFHEYCKLSFDVTDINLLSYSIIRSWIVSMSDNKISNRTINRKIASLKAYYKFLQKIGEIEVNPLTKHRALKTPKKLETPFSEIEMENVLREITYPDDFDGKRDRLIIHVLYTTGIRRAELINLKMKNLDLEGKSLKVLGKRNKERIIPLLQETIIFFKEYFVARESLPSTSNFDFVFLTKTGNKVYETLVYRIINKYFRKVSAKVKKSPHILRHTFATHLLNKGADLNSVKELLGHASLASTQVYTHNSIAELKKIHASSHPRGKK
ncbi:tyrosine-type recombinase/integrase [Maribacter sp. PR1]|uniref:Tyrosine-type recombinase/integrase n=1 Tax=Maribacter cobaltidurans TaxID=1178778 RepID=A0ABU7IWW9_9FLAO|nr:MULTISPECIES: tyrosine-type recombinase/integrase [Maribacter]MDC6390097.1 tyrosine-type recombinase/integrase [Maribacter sp. PR1]MEE1977487.1 tyrosine-type recombinase/integrase [Maribacter cobaltidurans]